MSTTTTTFPTGTGTGTRSPRTRRTARSSPLGWAVVIGAFLAVAVLAVITFGPGGDADAPSVRADPQGQVYEREAHLEGLERTYRTEAITPAPESDVAKPSASDQFLPGSRRVPTR